MADEVSVTEKICNCWPLEQPEEEYNLCIKLQADGGGRVHCDECGRPMSPVGMSRAEYFGRSSASGTLTPAEHTLLTLVHTMREYLPPDGISKDEFINRVLGVLDNDEMAELVGELEGRR